LTVKDFFGKKLFLKCSIFWNAITK